MSKAEWDEDAIRSLIDAIEKFKDVAYLGNDSYQYEDVGNVFVPWIRKCGLFSTHECERIEYAVKMLFDCGVGVATPLGRFYEKAKNALNAPLLIERNVAYRLLENVGERTDSQCSEYLDEVETAEAVKGDYIDVDKLMDRIIEIGDELEIGSIEYTDELEYYGGKGLKRI